MYLTEAFLQYWPNHLQAWKSVLFPRSTFNMFQLSQKFYELKKITGISGEFFFVCSYYISFLFFDNTTSHFIALQLSYKNFLHVCNQVSKILLHKCLGTWTEDPLLWGYSLINNKSYKLRGMQPQLLTLSLPWVTNFQFLLTISTQYQISDKNKEKYQFGDN